VTDDPTIPLVGEMEVTVGPGVPTVNEDPLVPDAVAREHSVKRFLSQSGSDADRRKIFEGNARKVYSRLRTKAAARATV